MRMSSVWCSFQKRTGIVLRMVMGSKGLTDEERVGMQQEADKYGPFLWLPIKVTPTSSTLHWADSAVPALPRGSAADCLPSGALLRLGAPLRS